MQVDSFNIISYLTDSSNLFSIPGYQRGIAWDSKQVEGFTKDMIKAADEDGRRMLMSTIYVNTDERTGRYALIDGQQRISHVLLLLKAISLFKKTQNGQEGIIARSIRLVGKPTFSNRVYHHQSGILETIKHILMTRQENGHEPRLISGPRDRTQMLEIMNAQSETEVRAVLSKKTEHPLYRNFSIMYDILKQDEKHPGDAFNGLQRHDIIRALISKENGESESIYFENANKENRPLSTMQRAWAHLSIHLAEPEMQQVLETRWIRDVEAPMRYSDRFLGKFFAEHCIVRYIHQSIRTDKPEISALHEFCERVGSEEVARNALELLLQDAQQYQIVAFPETTGDRHRLLRNAVSRTWYTTNQTHDGEELPISCSALDMSIVHGVLLACRLAVQKQVSDEAEYAQIVALLQTYLLHRQWAFGTHSNKGLNKRMNSLAQQIGLKIGERGNAEITLVRGELLGLLRRTLLKYSDNSRWPSAAEITNGLKSPLWNNLSPKLQRITLLSAERFLKDQNNEPQLEMSTTQIEHLLPTGVYGSRRELTDMFGNCLLTAKNAELGTKNIEEKFAILRREGMCIAKLAEESFQEHGSWEEAAIMTQSEKLSRVLIQAWPRPELSAAELEMEMLTSEGHMLRYQEAHQRLKDLHDDIVEYAKTKRPWLTHWHSQSYSAVGRTLGSRGDQLLSMVVYGNSIRLGFRVNMRDLGLHDNDPLSPRSVSNKGHGRAACVMSVPMNATTQDMAFIRQVIDRAAEFLPEEGRNQARQAIGKRTTAPKTAHVSKRA